MAAQRNPYTHEDQRLLARFLADYPPDDRRKPSTFQRFIDRHPDTNHTKQSWLDHYKKTGRTNIDSFIQQEKKKRKAAKPTPVDPATAPAHAAGPAERAPEAGPSHATPRRVPRASFLAQTNSAKIRPTSAASAPASSPANRTVQSNLDPESDNSDQSTDRPHVADHSPGKARHVSTTKKVIRPASLASAPPQAEDEGTDEDDDHASMLDESDGSEVDQLGSSPKPTRPSSTAPKSRWRHKFTIDDFDYFVKRLAKFNVQRLALGDLYKALAKERPLHTSESWKTFHRNHRDLLNEAADIYANRGKSAARKFSRRRFTPKSPLHRPASPDANTEEDRSTPSPRQDKGKGKANDEPSVGLNDEVEAVEFTEEDDELWITQHVKAQIKGYKAQAVWDFLGRQHDHHAPDEWEAYYKDKVFHFWERIAAKGQDLIEKAKAAAAEAASGEVATALAAANAKRVKIKTGLAKRNEETETSHEDDGQELSGSPDQALTTLALLQPSHSPFQLAPAAPASPAAPAATPADPSPPTPPRSGSLLRELEASIALDSDDRRLAKDLLLSNRNQQPDALAAAGAEFEFTQYAWPLRTRAEERMFSEFEGKVQALLEARQRRVAGEEEEEKEEEEADEEVVEESAPADEEDTEGSQGRVGLNRAAAMAEALAASIEEPEYNEVHVDLGAQPKRYSTVKPDLATSHKRAREDSGSQGPAQASDQPPKKRRLTKRAASEAVVDPDETPQVKLKRDLKAAAAKHKLTFKQVRSLFHVISAPTNLAVLDSACAFFSADSPEHPEDEHSPEFVQLKRLARRVAWSAEEDWLVFGATADEVSAVERRKGRRCLVARGRYLKELGVVGREGIVSGWPFE